MNWSNEHQHHHHLHHRPHFTRDLGPFSTLTEPRSVHLAFTSLDKHPLAFLTRPSVWLNCKYCTLCHLCNTNHKFKTPQKRVHCTTVQWNVDWPCSLLQGRHRRNKKCKSIENCSDSHSSYWSINRGKVDLINQLPVCAPLLFMTEATSMLLEPD